MSLRYIVHITSSILLFNRRILCNTEWISPPSPKLPRGDNSMAVASYNYSIYLLGGGIYGYQLVEYDIYHDIFNDHGSHTLPNDIYGESSYYTQIDNILYIIDRGGDTLLTYNMKTDEFNSNYQSIPSNVDVYGCLASNTDYLFVVGGYSYSPNANLDIVQVLDLSKNIWFDNVPSMQERRVGFSCVVDPFTDILYAIGGYTYTSKTNTYTYTDTIEKINTNNIIDNSWSYIAQSLYFPLAWTRSIVYMNTMYVIGGGNGPSEAWADFDAVHEINLITETVSISPHRLSYAVSSTASIIVDNILYVFGGNGFNGVIFDSWMLYEFNTRDPTNDPMNTVTTVIPITISPTNNPTKTLLIPSLTNDQTTAPSDYPTFHPISLSPIPEPTYSATTDYTNNTHVLSTAKIKIVTYTTDQLIDDEMRTTIELLNKHSSSNSELYIVLSSLCGILCVAMFCVYMIYKKEAHKAVFKKSISMIRKQASQSVDDVGGGKRLGVIERVLSEGMVRTVEGIQDDMDDEENIAQTMNTETKHSEINLVTVTGAQETKRTKMIFKKEEEKRAMVQYWLKTVVKLPFYYTVFIENGYETMEIIREITDNSELCAIGINNTDHQTRIMTEVLLLRKEM